MSTHLHALCCSRVSGHFVVGLFVLGLLMFMAGCDVLSPPENSEEEEQGTLLLNFSEDQFFLSKTIEPGVDMEVVTFDIYGAGPQGEMFEFLDFSESSIFQVALTPGQWEIIAFAKNPEGIEIGSGESVSAVVAGQVTSATIVIVPFEGQGQLSIGVSWPDSVLSAPDLTGNLNPANSLSTSMDFQMAADALSSTYEDSLPGGYYQMTLQLWDNTNLVWGTVEAVRILAGYASEESYVLQKEINQSGFGLVLVDSIINPVDIEFTGVVDSLAAGQGMTINANTNGEDLTYQWFLMGEPLDGETGESITIGSTLEPGTYWLDLLVQSGAMLSSGRVIFEVYATDDTYTQIGPLVITEVMANPAAVSDTDGEWFEIINVDSVAIDLSGWGISEDGIESHVISEQLIMNPGDVFVIARNEADSTNGGVEVDYAFDGLNLGNNNDAIYLISPEGTVVDLVRWSDANPLPMDAGQSAELVDPLLDNLWNGNWEAATTVYGDGDYGTPGIVN